MMGRIAWYAMLLALAAIIIAVQIDRQSAVAPAMAELTPQPVRGFAQAQIAARARQSGPPERALEEAKRLVARRPIPAETLRLLAQAQFAAGQAEAGFTTIQVAARRGWRDPVAQESMLRLAVAVGDEAEAARRYTALMLQNRTQDALLKEFGTTLFGGESDEAAQSLVDVLAGADRWSSAFLRRGARVLPPDAFARIISEAASKGAEFDCGALQAASRAISDRSSQAAAMIVAVAEKSC